ncbi:MAG: phosphoribosyl-AMP cyclohydrolase [Anaerolineales bacterium]|nr:phosphoribosyl-AMP cyclohydrolase [Anaerolineales bacterium]
MEKFLNPEELKFDSQGLLPVVVQDQHTGQVLMLAYMNRQALELTLQSGKMVFWSRSRQSLWHKGETSGNVQRLVALYVDCDADCLLALVEPSGPACHTGNPTCFYRALAAKELE